MIDEILGKETLDAIDAGIPAPVEQTVQNAPIPTQGIPGIISGKERMPPKVLIYGTNGIGKSTFAASAPNPIFVQTEDGLATIGVDRFPLSTASSEVEAHLSTLLVAEHKYHTVVIDSVDWLENIILSEICQKNGWSDLSKSPYASYRKMEPVYWDRIIKLLDDLNKRRRMAVVLIAHAGINRFEDPETESYDMYAPRLEPKVMEKLCEWVDAIGFAVYEKNIRVADKTFNSERKIAQPVKGAGSGQSGRRILRFSETPACKAKNRYGITGSLDLSWNAFFDYVKKSWN